MFTTEFLDIPPLVCANGVVRLPGSKSISNRVLLLAALCSDATTEVCDLLASDDTHVMLEALKELGCHIVQPNPQIRTFHITGFKPLEQRQAHLFLGNAGTAMRPLTAALALLGGTFELSGVPRMHERPIGDLVCALRQLGCQIEYLGNEGFPPLRITPASLNIDAPIKVRGDVSSQFLTALLLALPLASQNKNIEIEVIGTLISQPYIAITLNLLARFGINVVHQNWQRFTIPAGSRYQSPGRIHVEADASSASYFIALGAISAAIAPTESATKNIRIEGLGASSIQGDIRFIEAAELMGAHIRSGENWLEIGAKNGALCAIDLDCNHIPDAAMTLAMMALYANGTSTLRNIASWRVKETDRIAAMACELRKLGATIEEGADFIRITPPATTQHWRAASIQTYDDHRIAMCFSLAAFNPAMLPVRIEDPKCVAKTFPDYFETLFSVSQPASKGVPVICIDGPTASGKGTIAAALAQRLGYHFLDSGSIYRVTALACEQAKISIDSVHEAQIAQMAAQLPLRFEAGQVFLNNIDVSLAIRSENMGTQASQVSALPAVRQALVALQHSFRALPGLVADGRDMGSVIFPDAALKVFLTANTTCRATRRHRQLIGQGFSAKIDDLYADLEARDARDIARSASPLVPAKDALLLDSSDLNVEQTLDQIVAWWQGKQPFGAFQKAK